MSRTFIKAKECSMVHDGFLVNNNHPLIISKEATQTMF